MAAEQKALTPLTALTVSALILPGLGQLLTGRRVRGGIMAGAMLVWLVVAIVRVGRDLMSVLPALTARAQAGEVLGFSDLQNVMAPLGAGMTWVFMPLVTIWVWSLADSIQYCLRSRRI